MSENIKVRWLTDHEQTKIAPKTLSTQIMNEDGTRFKDTVESAIVNAEAQTTAHASNNDIHVTAEEKEAWNSIEVPSLDGYATEEYVESLVKKLSATLALSFYCIEDVTVITNGISKVYPANSSVEIVFSDEDVFEIVPTSNESILSLTAFPGALGTFYPWLEGVAQFSNILFDMNDVDFYSKWSQGNQGAYHVQKAQYTNCIFWSDNPYVSDVSKRTNYTLTHTSQLPLCYSSIPDNTFKSFYLAFGVNSDPNWGNRAYLDSFAKATWATQVFSYYGARTIGIVGHDDPDFNIVLPKDCRGLMFDARHIENAGTFDAINTTNFGAKSGSWREAFGFCPSLKRLYIKNLKVNLNISWSPIDYDSISYIISAAANTNAITISVSPYTYNLLSPADFTAAADKNITIALITTNYVEDRRLNTIADKADKSYVDNKITDLVNSAITNKQNKNIIVSRDSNTGKATMTAPEIMEKVRAGENVYFTINLYGGTLHPYLEGADTGVFFYSNYIDNDRVIGTGVLVDAEGNISNETYQLAHLNDDTIHITATERTNWNAAKTHADSAHAPFDAQKNQNAFSNIAVSGQTTVAADTATDTITFAGSNVTITTDAANDKVTFSVADGSTSAKGVVQLTNSTSSTSTTTAATPNSVKSAYDLANTANTAADTAQTRADAAYDLAEDHTHTKSEITDFPTSLKNPKAITFTGAVTGTYDGSAAKTVNIVGKAGTGTKAELFNNAEGASGNYSHAEGNNTTASGNYSHAEGGSVSNSNVVRKITGDAGAVTYTVDSVTDIKVGNVVKYNNIYAVVTSVDNTNNTIILGKTLSDVALDNVTAYLVRGIAYGEYSHAECYNTIASGNYSHAEGSFAIASGRASHAECWTTTASGIASHAEGYHTTASGLNSHAEGDNTTASGNCSHAEGQNTIASGNNSHAEGDSTIASGRYQHAQGKYNIDDITSAHIVGNGDASNPSNAHTLDWDGNAWFAGDVYVGSTSGTNKDEGSVKLAKLSEIPTKTSDLSNDSGFLTSYTETDPTVPAWAKASTKPTYTASEVGADVAGTADTLVSTHANNKSNPHEVTAAQLGLKTESWTFTLEDGSTVTKVVYVG